MDATTYVVLERVVDPRGSPVRYLLSVGPAMYRLRVSVTREHDTPDYLQALVDAAVASGRAVR